MYDQVYKSVLSKIKPNKTEQQEQDQLTVKFVSALNKTLAQHKAKAILGGSSAKETWLTDNKEVDIFVQFPYQQFKVKSSKLSDLLEPIIKKTFAKHSIERVHGSRDYFQIRYNNFLFEVVPILEINEAKDAINITDISPLHAKWVNKQGKKIKDEIRLAKQFCKAQQLYGAESYLNSFSGYMLEILTIHYGNFEKLLKAAVKWREPVIVDVEGYHKTKHKVFFELNKSKLHSPIIIIDPVDKYRNAAAALSKEKFQLFKKKAKEFLDKPSTELFAEKKLDLVQLKKSKQYLVYLEMDVLEGKRDVVGAKLLKVFKHLRKEFKKYSLINAGWEWSPGESAKMYYLLKIKKLPKIEIKSGPPMKFKEHVKEFKMRNKDYYEENGQIMAKVKILQPKLKDFTKKAVQDKYVIEKIVKVSKVGFNF
ncbi:MAG: hypothetical protein ABIG93_00770 [archaeon]|nr:hypothetical protein [Nanoarchaeota archaeon]